MLKIVLVGDTGVGKTSIAQRLVNEGFSENHIPTVGTCFFDLVVNGRAVSLWDTAGQERFSSITVTYFRNTTIALVVYDMSQPSTIDSANKWCNRVLAYSPDASIVVVGNKRDLITDSTPVTIESGIHHIEVSAKTGHGIADLHYIISDLVSRAEPEPVVSVSWAPPTDDKQCC